MFKFGEEVVARYVESPQQNPLRWEMLYRDEEGTFHPQTAKMKCKDYFNDVVAVYQKCPYLEPVHGFNPNSIKVNEEGQWVRLHHLKMDVFVKNFETIIRPEVEATFKVAPEFTPMKANTGLLFIPRALYDSTYYISLFTQLIRVSNYGQEFTSLDDMLSNSSPISTIERRDSLSLSILKKIRFNLPDEVKDYWWYFNKDFNSKAKFASMYSLHDNGCIAWVGYCLSKI